METNCWGWLRIYFLKNTFIILDTIFDSLILSMRESKITRTDEN
jgi:hypothetical protein